MADTRTWWLTISSDDLLGYLRQAHEGEDPSIVLAQVYLNSEDGSADEESDG